jgi:hypothetical protein
MTFLRIYSSICDDGLARKIFILLSEPAGQKNSKKPDITASEATRISNFTPARAMCGADIGAYGS